MRVSKIRLSYLLTFTSAHVAATLGRIGNDRLLWRWTSRFCGSEPGDCTLGAEEVEALVHAAEYLLRRHHGARASAVSRSIVRSLEGLFWLFHDAIERCLDVDDKDCICSWNRRVSDAEELTRFLFEVVQAYWSTGADRGWMSKHLETLACHAADLSNRDGQSLRHPDDDVSTEARAGRLSILLFDMANGLACDNWAEEPWMLVVPGQ